MTKITKLLCLAQLENIDPDLFVHSGDTERKYGNCNKAYKPTDVDISTRRPSTYWEQCGKCREYLRQRGTIHFENKNLIQ